jgi:hypothetical protein
MPHVSPTVHRVHHYSSIVVYFSLVLLSCLLYQGYYSHDALTISCTMHNILPASLERIQGVDLNGNRVGGWIDPSVDRSGSRHRRSGEQALGAMSPGIDKPAPALGLGATGALLPRDLGKRSSRQAQVPAWPKSRRGAGVPDGPGVQEKPANRPQGLWPNGPY